MIKEGPDLKGDTIADYGLLQEYSRRNRFFFAFKEACEIRSKATRKLAGITWKPWDCEVSDVLIIPNNLYTYFIVIKYASGNDNTLSEFMRFNGIDLSFFE
jgi:hypothetical protein